MVVIVASEAEQGEGQALPEGGEGLEDSSPVEGLQAGGQERAEALAAQAARGLP